MKRSQTYHVHHFVGYAHLDELRPTPAPISVFDPQRRYRWMKPCLSVF